MPFRRFLTRESYRVEAGEKVELTPAVVMRRMTKVSPYPYWHFFDAYPPGFLRAVYRANGDGSGVLAQMLTAQFGCLAYISSRWSQVARAGRQSKSQGDGFQRMRQGGNNCCLLQNVHGTAGQRDCLRVLCNVRV